MNKISAISIVREPIQIAIRFNADGLSAPFVRAFGSALIAEFARLRFFFTGIVIRLGPMTAVGAEMPYISVVSAAISDGHSVCALSGRFWANLEPWLTQWRDGRFNAICTL